MGLICTGQLQYIQNLKHNVLCHFTGLYVHASSLTQSYHSLRLQPEIPSYHIIMYEKCPEAKSHNCYMLLPIFLVNNLQNLRLLCLTHLLNVPGCEMHSYFNLQRDLVYIRSHDIPVLNDSMNNDEGGHLPNTIYL